MATIPIAEMITKEVVQHTWRRWVALGLLSLSLVDMAEDSLSTIRRHCSLYLSSHVSKRLRRTVELFRSCDRGYQANLLLDTSNSTECCSGIKV